LTLHPQQLEVLDQDVVQQLEAAAGQLQRLEIAPESSKSYLGMPKATDAQLMGMRRLFRARSRLAGVQISMPIKRDHAYWVLDPSSSSPSTAMGPPLPLSSWEWPHFPGDLFLRWVGGRQLGRTLRRLVLTDENPPGLGVNRWNAPLDISGLAAARGLEDLTVGMVVPSSLQRLSSSSSLTRLEVAGSKDAYGEGPDTCAEAACALTSLQHLVLSLAAQRLPSRIGALKQLSCLHISAYGLRQLPADLGTRLPRLVRLVAGRCKVAAVPASLSRLTHLDLACNWDAPLTLPATLAGSLKELRLTSCDLATIQGLSRLTALEMLAVPIANVLGSSLTVIRPLTRLRHLAIQHCGLDDGYPDPSSFTVIGALQQLTSIRVTGESAACWKALASASPPLGLKELFLKAKDNSGALAALKPWLYPATALTRLSLARDSVGLKSVCHTWEMAFLPVQLRELDLGCVEWADGYFPGALHRLTALEVLHVRFPATGLPTWFTKLSRLEGLGLWDAPRSGRGEPSQLAILAGLPSLRAVRLQDSRGSDLTVPYDYGNRLAASTWQVGN
jgi:hypothetical protein